MRGVTLLLAAVPATLAWAQMSRTADTVLTPTRALVVVEPLMIVGSFASSMSVSPNGRYLVAQRMIVSTAPISIERPRIGPEGVELVIWDSATGSTRTIPLPNNAHPQTAQLSWFGGTNKAIVEVAFSNYPVRDAEGKEHIVGFASEAYILDAANGTMRLARDSKDYLTRSWRFVASPLSDVAVEVSAEIERSVPQAVIVGSDAVTQKTPQFSLRTLSADGTWGPLIKLPATHFVSGRKGWSVDGSELLLECQVYGQPGGRPVPMVLHFNPATGETYETTGAMASYEPPPSKSDVALERKTIVLEEGSAKRPTQSWWLRSKTETERPVAFVAEHADLAVLPMGDKYIAYLQNGVVFVRQIIELNLQQYESMFSAAQRSALLSNAKQVGLAAIMYAMDHDEVIPDGIDPTRDFMPYLRNEKVLSGFVWVFPGGKLSDIKNPAETMMGYIEGPGGRAVTYMDGHVKWVPDE